MLSSERLQGTPQELGIHTAHGIGHPPEDAFMVPGFGYQPVPPEKYVAGNDNREGGLWVNRMMINGVYGWELARAIDDNHPVCMPDFQEYPGAVDLETAMETFGELHRAGYVGGGTVPVIIDTEYKLPRKTVERLNSQMSAFTVAKEHLAKTIACYRVDNAGKRSFIYSDGSSEPTTRSYAEVEREAQDRHGDFMQTYTGRKFWPMDACPDEVNIFDIAHSLSLQCRYAGHCKRFYSVAEHSTLMARWLRGKYDAPTAMWGLLHDAAEAYLVDVPRPVKPFLTGYKAAEAAVMRAVCIHFGLPVDAPPEVHEADTRIIGDELVNLRPMDWHGRYNDPLGVPMMYWVPGMAEVEFLATYRALAKQIPGMWEEAA